MNYMMLNMLKMEKTIIYEFILTIKCGISLEDCETVSNAINDILDNENMIQEQYFLEVSSPGIERVLRTDKHLEKNIGSDVLIKLYKPYEKTKQISGRLKSFDKDNITVETKETSISLERKNIAQIKTIFKWN